MRLIDAIKYSDTLVWMHHNGDYQSPQDAIKAALFNLAQSPTITLDDLRPKGRWELKDARYSRCTNCNKDRNIRTQIGWEFCPRCGADMRGEANG